MVTPSRRLVDCQGSNHDQALRALGNRLVGCLRHRTLSDETVAWARYNVESEQAA